MNILPNISDVPGTNNAWSSTRSKHSAETFASKVLRRSVKAQWEALPTNDIVRRTKSITRLGSTPLLSSADKAICHNPAKGLSGSRIRPARFRCRRSSAVLKLAPFRLKNFLRNESTFFARRSGWKGTGVTWVIAFLADLDRPWKAASAAKATIESGISFAIFTSGTSLPVTERREDKGVSTISSAEDFESLELEELDAELEEDEYVWDFDRCLDATRAFLPFLEGFACLRFFPLWPAEQCSGIFFLGASLFTGVFPREPCRGARLGASVSPLSVVSGSEAIRYAVKSFKAAKKNKNIS